MESYVESLSDELLYRELRERGIPVGPVVASTRRLYEKKLKEILGGGGDDIEEDRTPQSTSVPEVRSRRSVNTFFEEGDDGAQSSGGRHRIERDEVSPSWHTSSSYSASSSWRTDRNDSDQTFKRRSDHPYGYLVRERNSFADPSPTRQHLAAQHEFRPSKTSVNQNGTVGIKLWMSVLLILFLVAFAYMVFNAWEENDPYKRIEAEVLEFLEETETKKEM